MKLTLTLEIPGKAAITRVIDPGNHYGPQSLWFEVEDMRRLLADPPKPLTPTQSTVPVPPENWIDAMGKI